MRGRVWILASLLSLPSLPLRGEAPPEGETKAEAAAPAKSFEIGAQIRLRGEFVDNLDLRGDADDRDAFTLSRIRLSALLRKGPLLSAFVELQDSRVFGGEASTVSNEKGVDLHQGFLRVGTDARFVRLGRQELVYGEQRLVGTFDWDNVGRAFDGVLARGSFLSGKLGVDLFATKIKESSGPPERNDVDFDGLYATGRFLPDVDAEAYLLYARYGEKNAAGDDRLVGTVGARLHGKWTRLVYDAEGAWQFGHQFGDDRRAWMFAGYMRWELGGPLNPAVGFEWSRATGDGNPSDGVYREFDNLFPTNHLRYGYLDLLGLRNNQMLGASVQIAGDRVKWSARLVGKLLGVDEPAGRWTSATGIVLGQDTTGGSGRRIGEEVDAVLSTPVVPGLVAHLQAGWFHPGRFAEAVRGKSDAYGAAAFLVFTY